MYLFQLRLALVWVVTLGLVYPEPIISPSHTSLSPRGLSQMYVGSGSSLAKQNGSSTPRAPKRRRTWGPTRATPDWWFWNELVRGRNSGRGVSWSTAEELSERASSLPEQQDQRLIRHHCYWFYAYVPLTEETLRTLEIPYKTAAKAVMQGQKHTLFIMVNVEGKQDAQYSRIKGLIHATSYFLDVIPNRHWTEHPPGLIERLYRRYKLNGIGIMDNPDITYEPILDVPRVGGILRKRLAAWSARFFDGDPVWSDTHNCSTYARYLATLPNPGSRSLQDAGPSHPARIPRP